MADEPEQQRAAPVLRRLRSIETAAIAGLLHSLLSLVATFMLLSVPDPAAADSVIADWYSDGGNQRRLILVVNLLTLSSIMFVWFVAVIRRRIGQRENRFFGTVFFGSALLLTSAWLVAAVLFVAPAIAAHSFDVVPTGDTVAMSQAGGLTMASVVATRLEAVFIISATTVGRLSAAFPRWIIVAGYAVGLVLMLVQVPNELITWIFPIWVAAVSAVLLVRAGRIEHGVPG